MAHHAEKILKNLNRFRNDDDRFCDIEVVVNEVKFKAHRDVLRASSGYFEDLLNNIENNQKSVELYSLDPTVFRSVLDFIYSGDLNLQTSNVRDLLVTGKTLEMPEIVEKCCDALYADVKISNAIKTLHFANDNQLDRLKEHTIEIIGSEFSSISEQRELLDLSKDTFVEILLAKLWIDDECLVFETVLRWLNHDIEHRGKYSFEVLCCVRLSNVPIQQISEAVEHSSDPLLNMALNSLKNCVSIERVSSHKKLKSLTMERISSEKKSVYVFGEKKVIKYDTELNKWQKQRVEFPPYNFGNNIVTIIGEQVFLFNSDRSGFVINPQDDKWNSKSVMMCPLKNFGLCEFGGKIWVFGEIENSHLAVCCYDPLKDVWTEIGKMNAQKNLMHMRVVSFEGLIYLVGGADSSSGDKNKLISYNPATNEWKALNSFQAKCYRFGAAVLGRYLYIVGGRCGSYLPYTVNTVERYSFDQNTWDCVSSMTENRWSPAVYATNGLLYVFGGRDSDKLSSVECFDPVTNEWTKCESAPRSIGMATAFIK